MKRFLSLLLALLMVFSLALGLVACDEPEEPPVTNGDGGDGDGDQEEGGTPPAEEVEGETIDIYLIAGQSNAAGHTKINDRLSIYTEYPELQNGYTNVLYSGNSRGDLNGSTKLNPREIDWTRAKLGFGVADTLHMGPEAGMAAALASHYNKESGKYAGIIKMAHGGTGLLAGATTGSNKFGNWMPPSYAASIGVSWGDGTELGSIHGGLYRELLREVKKQIEDLENYNKVNFTKVNIKGLYWMQGCNDRYRDRNEYRKAFQYFVSDLREDLADMMIEMTGSDCGASNMAVFVGTISQTFSLNSPTTEVDVNIPFINMQKALPDHITNCYVVDNSQYAIGRWDPEKDDGEGGKGAVVALGSDAGHWNQNDMLDIGVNVGNMMIEKCTQ